MYLFNYVLVGRVNFKRIKTFKDGRDEMNLVEFPFATLSERTGNTNVLEFQRDVYDRVLGKPVTRKLTVTGDAKYGLPTAKDEEVCLGLIQLTKLNNEFTSPKVQFTRSQLIDLMGWKNRDWSYHRIATAFCRLTGVRLFYENAWRDNAKRKFCTQGGFGLLDSFQLRDGRIREEGERLSEFRWNSVVFDSFQSGYLKKLDYATVKKLSATARRIYRYLDKHFHPPHRATIVLPLRIFAFEHIGVSRKSDNAQIRRALEKPIRELEVLGFLVPSKNRYKKITGQRGEWEIQFTLAGHGKRRRNKSTPPKTFEGSKSKQPDRIDRYIESLSAADRATIEDQAMENATGFLRENATKDGPLADECRRQILRTFLSTRF